MVYIVKIKLSDEARSNELVLEKHRKWFLSYCERGDFLLAGPIVDTHGAGLIVSKDMSLTRLQEILDEDAFDARLATREIIAVEPKAIAPVLVSVFDK